MGKGISFIVVPCSEVNTLSYIRLMPVQVWLCAEGNDLHVSKICVLFQS
jgi:hypothetical protein